MSYFAPYIDGSGLHMPTYENRLSALTESYRSIFGLDAELSESVPDYQLLSVFAGRWMMPLRWCFRPFTR